MFSQVGELASSKSDMNTRAPEFSALITILRSVGPVISTRRSRQVRRRRRHPPVALAHAAGRRQEVGQLAVAQALRARAARAASSSSRSPSNSRASRCRNSTASAVSTSSVVTCAPPRAGGRARRRGSTRRAARSGGTRAAGGRARRSAALTCTRQPGLRARVGLRAGLEHGSRLALAELGRRLRLHEVVDAGAAAAEVLLGRLEAPQARDRVEHRPRLARRSPARGAGGRSPGRRP